MLDDMVHTIASAVRHLQHEGRIRHSLQTVFERLGMLGLASRHGAVPESEGAEARVKLQSLFQVLLLEAAEEMSSALTANHIKHFFTKGIALLGDVYRPGDRTMADIDVFVRYRDRDAAVELLESMGFDTAVDREQAGPQGMRTALSLVREGDSGIEDIPVDLHWSLDPVERALPRFENPLPNGFWKRVAPGSLPRPDKMDHAAILLHHLVHTDLLHFRSLIDAGVLLQGATQEQIDLLWASCEDLGIRRFAREALEVLAADLGVRFEAEIPEYRSLWRAPVPVLEDWIVMVCSADSVDLEAITLRRLSRRALTTDNPATPLSLAQDVLLPPGEFLRWRWPDAGGAWSAWFKHLKQVVKKARGTRTVE